MSVDRVIRKSPDQGQNTPKDPKQTFDRLGRAENCLRSGLKYSGINFASVGTLDRGECCELIPERGGDRLAATVSSPK
jgi:hypothetical protein